jgi:hypothetical protein
MRNSSASEDDESNQSINHFPETNETDATMHNKTDANKLAGGRSLAREN